MSLKYDVATILGRNFVSPEDIANALPKIDYQTDRSAADTWPDRESFEKFWEAVDWAEANNAILIPGPPEPLTFMQVRDLKKKLFPHYKPYASTYIKFLRTIPPSERVNPGWLAFSSDMVEGSVEKTWDEQLKLVLKPLEVPNVAEVAWGTLVYLTVHYLFLFNTEVRTSTLLGEKLQMTASTYGTYGPGLEIGSDSSDWTTSDRGILTVRKF